MLNSSGLAAASHMNSVQFGSLFRLLEDEQRDFLGKETLFRSPTYRWYGDALHNWSRVWEYPYVYYHLQAWCRQSPNVGGRRIADVGSGVTFFPFAAAKLGLDVICTDVDPVCSADIARAAECVPHTPGSVSFRLGREYALPFEDDELDGACCISVLEHVPDPPRLVAEIARVVKPGGRLFLTMDLDLRGDQALSPEGFYAVQESLLCRFAHVLPIATVHPGDLLVSTKGPYRVSPPSPARTVLGWLRGRCKTEAVVGALLRRPPYCLTCGGWVFERMPHSGLED